MTIDGRRPDAPPELQVESVRGGRRAALFVAALAIVVVGTLIWKPWDLPLPAPVPPSALPGARAAVASPTAVGATVPATPTQAPATLLPTGTSGPESGQAPLDLGSVALPPDDQGTFVYCVYGLAADKSADLITMVVNPPVVTTGNAVTLGAVRSVNFQPEVEVNSLQSIFSAEWSFLNSGRNQRSRLNRGRVVLFKPQEVKVHVGDLPANAVLRVAVVINWMGADGQRLASQRLYPAAYTPLGDTATEPIPEGCPARN